MTFTPTGMIRPAVGGALLCIVGLFVSWGPGATEEVHAFHSDEELISFKAAGGGLPGGMNNYFVGSATCYGCHGPDQNNYASIDDDGNDVNVMDDWRSTMMANAAHDPFWRAKVSHEVLVNPGHQAALEDKCTSCHAPQGRFDKFLTGQGMYSIAEMMQDPIAKDGVSCLPCHMQKADSIGLLFSGNLRFDTINVLYGPYTNMFGSPMSSFVGFDPQYGEHINDAGLCAGCHTLITETADLSGNPTGDHFVEQATYHEWLNSVFNTDTDPVNGISCQGCHVPRIDDAVVISANYLFLTGKSPYGLHHFAGANVFMLEMLKGHINELGLTADQVQFDSTIARTERMLQQHSLMIDLSLASRTLDTAYVDLELINLAGHKFPSGYPARRAFVEMVVLDAANDTLFRSGITGSDFEIIGHDPIFEPHYDVIRSEDQAQIYEMVMADVNGNKTTVLERAKESLKDNRLAPLGFTSAHSAYDTAVIAGGALTDPDFNRDALGTEGTGADVVHYHIPMGGYSGMITIKTRILYQSAPPLWMQEMFAYNSAAIDSFRNMYQDADNTPILVVQDSLIDLSIGVDEFEELGVNVYPNPMVGEVVHLSGLTSVISSVELMDAQGRSIRSYAVKGERLTLVLPQGSGTYMLTFRTNKGNWVRKVVKLR